MVVRERAMTERVVDSAGPHCDETESKKRLAEVVCRMRMPEAEQQAFQEALLPPAASGQDAGA